MGERGARHHRGPDMFEVVVLAAVAAGVLLLFALFAAGAWRHI